MNKKYLLIAAMVWLFAVTPSHAQTTQPTAAVPAAPTAEQSMNRLLAPSPNAGQPLQPVTPPTVATPDNTSGKAAVVPDAPVVNLVREGTYRTNRTGRLSHTPDGQQAIFTFDTDGTTLADPPMIILPNLKLLSMENAVTGQSKDVHFRVSGKITEYKGRNYILLDKAVVVADVDQQM
jgi:hypothetical protein